MGKITKKKLDNTKKFAKATKKRGSPKFWGNGVRTSQQVVVHGYLRLKDCKTRKYKESPAARWDVEPEDPAQIDKDANAEANVGLVGVPLKDQDLTHEESSSSNDEDFGIGDDQRALEMIEIPFSSLTFCHFVVYTHFDMAMIHYYYFTVSCYLAHCHHEHLYDI